MCCYEDSDETSHFVKGGEFLDWLPLSASQQEFYSMDLVIWFVPGVPVSVQHRVVTLLVTSGNQNSVSGTDASVCL